MVKRIFVFFVLIFISVSVASSAFVRVKVGGIADGDTLFLENRPNLRLMCIDAPEIDHESGKNQYYALAARDFLWRLVRGKILFLRDVKHDRFGRMLAQAYLPDGTWLNFLLVRKGYAFYFPHKREKCLKILQAQRWAMQEEVGFWKKILHLPCASQDFIGNKRSRRFHTLRCKFGKRISRFNRVIFHSLYAAFYQGYAPARCCTVWPIERLP
ncbi:MAG: thermonuclease family protein [Desulfonauticus sp.]|nr:thermonuclease family protein [Desulfonauticus sp.]